MRKIMGLIGVMALGVVLWPSATRSAPDSHLGLPSELAGYREWRQLLKSPYQVPLELWVRCVAPTADDWAAARQKYGPHAERYIRVYGNPSAVAAVSSSPRAPFPSGAVLVKEKLLGSPHGAPEGVAFMLKRGEPQFRDSGGWEFRYFPDSGETRRTQEACASCHRAAASTDYVFGQYPR